MNKKTIGIIGFGNFGALLASVLSQHARVLVTDLSRDAAQQAKARLCGVELTDLATVAQSELVILAVPISATEATIQAIAPHLQAQALVLDTCSVKVYPCRWLKKHLPRSVEIMGTHPMFGPTTTKFQLTDQTWTLAGHQIVLCPLRLKANTLATLKRFLQGLGLTVIETSPADHDRQNAKTLSLVHFLGRSLLRAGVGEQTIFTPGYADLLSILPHTTGDKWQLFYDMNNYNPYAEQVRRTFMTACDSIESKVEQAAAPDEFAFARQQIDKLDNRIMGLLFQRFKLVKRIGSIKKKQGLAVVDRQREAEIIKKISYQTKLSPDFVKKLYKLIFEESYKYQVK